MWKWDGNYNRTAPIKWKSATAIIWLDFSLRRTLYQSVKRALGRALTRKELWPGTGNRESLVRSFLSKDSILLWMLKTHAPMRNRYESMARDSRYSNMVIFRLQNWKDAESFLKKVDAIKLGLK